MGSIARQVLRTRILFALSCRAARQALQESTHSPMLAAAASVASIMLQNANELPSGPWQGFACHYAKGGRQGGKKQAGSQAAKRQAAAAEEDEEDQSKDDDDGPGFDIEEYEAQMLQGIEHFQKELSGVRTGRANPGLLENIMVEAASDKLPLRACGTVTVRNPQTLAVSVYDSEMVGAVVRAIQNSPLSLAPTHEGSEVLVRLPRMSRDTIERMVKLVHAEAEEAHLAVRRARHKALEVIKKAFKSADERKWVEKEVQKLHDRYIAEVNRLRGIKDNELKEHKA